MKSKQQEELEEAVNKLVEDILHRGRLNQREIMGEIAVRDGGINMAKANYIRKIMTLAENEAVLLADKLIGKDVEVRTVHNDIMDEESQPHLGDEAVKNFQIRQRITLAEYQNPQPKTEDWPGQSEGVSAMAGDTYEPERVDPKTSKVTDTALLNDELSEAEA